MAHIFAGILGPLAFLTALTRGIIHGGGAESTLFSAWCALLVFSGIGCVAGWLAGRIVAEAVQARIETELAARDAQQAAPAEKPNAAGA